MRNELSVWFVWIIFWVRGQVFDRLSDHSLVYIFLPVFNITSWLIPLFLNQIEFRFHDLQVVSFICSSWSAVVVFFSWLWLLSVVATASIQIRVKISQFKRNCLWLLRPSYECILRMVKSGLDLVVAKEMTNAYFFPRYIRCSDLDVFKNRVVVLGLSAWRLLVSDVKGVRVVSAHWLLLFGVASVLH